MPWKPEESGEDWLSPFAVNKARGPESFEFLESLESPWAQSLTETDEYESGSPFLDEASEPLGGLEHDGPGAARRGGGASMQTAARFSGSALDSREAGSLRHLEGEAGRPEPALEHESVWSRGIRSTNGADAVVYQEVTTESDFEEAEVLLRDVPGEGFVPFQGVFDSRMDVETYEGLGQLMAPSLFEFQTAPSAGSRVVKIVKVWRRPPFPRGLKTGILARATVRIPTRDLLGWFINMNQPAVWFRRLDIDLLEVAPEADVTIEAFKQLRPNLSDPEIFASTRRYLELRHQTDLKATRFWSGHIYSLRATTIQNKLGIDLSAFIKAARLTGIPPRDVDDHLLVVYASFPSALEASMVPERKFVLDRFVFAEHALTDAHVTPLEQLGRVIADAENSSEPIRTIRLMGHTDSVGKESGNINLGLRRADAVRQGLIQAIETQKRALAREIGFFVESLGEQEPVTSNKTEDGRAQNRRVEVFVSKLGKGPAVTGRQQRVTIESVSERGLKILKQPSSHGIQITQETADRLSCLLRKVLPWDADDRYVDVELVLSVYNTGRPRPEFRHAKNVLTIKDAFGPAVDSQTFVRRLQDLDASIIDAFDKINQLKAQQGAAVSRGIEMIGAWIVDRMKTDVSTYSCYRNL